MISRIFNQIAAYKFQQSSNSLQLIANRSSKTIAINIDRLVKQT